ncbi:CoA transferase [Sporosarcina sp. 179-K 3D1 HS]|uniref:CaiB/BaiF CoA transferase family protein n=1 Tax=Sporosarcina sp. 179-K 3D1 HS TaxID=3232169 RepID=UPI0039A24F6E
MSSLPLEGIRILDLSMWWSGPICTSYLGAQGAEVIKVESIQAPDGFRYTATLPGNDWWEFGAQFNSANLNKVGITLNLSDPKGKKLFTELVEKSDVVIENFSARVMENFGLDYEVLRQVNPKIIMLSMPAYGKTGPFGQQPGFAYTFEILSGIAQVNGYEGGNPSIISGVGDVIAGSHTAFALLSALEYRERTGKGQAIEVAQVEACANMVGQAISEFSMNGNNWGRSGNRQPGFAPHGIYRSKGEDSWVAIAVNDETEWRSFCKALGEPMWSRDERFQTMEGRCEHQDELDSLIETWTSRFGHYEAANLLQAAGVNAGPVLEVDEIVEDPFLEGMFQEMTRELIGSHKYPSWPIKFSGERILQRTVAPMLGQHNEYVLSEILGLTDEEIQQLEQDDIIGTVPIGARGTVETASK